MADTTARQAARHRHSTDRIRSAALTTLWNKRARQDGMQTEQGWVGSCRARQGPGAGALHAARKGVQGGPSKPGLICMCLVMFIFHMHVYKYINMNDRGWVSHVRWRASESHRR